MKAPARIPPTGPLEIYTGAYTDDLGWCLTKYAQEGKWWNPDTNQNEPVLIMTGPGGSVFRQYALDRVEGSKTIPLSMTTQTLKLLDYALAMFTAKVFGSVKQTDPAAVTLDQRTVTFPLKDFLRDLGIAIDPASTGDPEADKKEAARVSNFYKLYKKRTDRDLDILYSLTVRFDWQHSFQYVDKDETVKLRKGAAAVSPDSNHEFSFLEDARIENGLVIMVISEDLARYHVAKNTTQTLPRCLLACNGKSEVSYPVGKKLAQRYFMKPNKAADLNDRIKIEKLMKVCPLFDIENLKSKKRSWKHNIRDRFENCLADLADCGLLADEWTTKKGPDGQGLCRFWTYGTSNSVFLDQVPEVYTYRDWSSLLLYFHCTEPKDEKEQK